MASGLPAISTDVGGNRERPMGAAMLVPPDHRSMSMAISRLALDRDMRAELGKLSIAAAEANYSVAAAAKNLNAVLKKLGLL
jgi:glycosyltransferase involved in cell wall biosynthesis